MAETEHTHSSGGDIPAGAIPKITPVAFTDVPSAPGATTPGPTTTATAAPGGPTTASGRPASSASAEPTAPATSPVPEVAGPATPTEPITASQVRANAAAKRVLARLMRGENPPTAPLSIVDRLAGSPYANLTIRQGADDSARRTLDFVLKLAETMFRYGAGALEVETSIIAVTAAFGLQHVEVDITNQSVSIDYAPQDGTPI